MNKNINTQPNINLEQEAELTLNLGQGMEHFVITGQAEAVMPLAEAAQAYDAAHPVVTKPKAVEAPQTPVPAPNQYIDYSELPSRQVARMKVSSWIYDRQHGTRMLEMVNDKINADRDVAFARNLGLITTTHCAKHEKAVQKLRHLI